MLATFRRSLNTWPARLFFLLLVGVFIVWGVGDVVRNLGRDTSAASVAGRRIEMPELEEAYRRQLAQVTRMFGGKIEPTPEIRRSVAEQTIARLVAQAALEAEIKRLGLVVPDEALRQTVYELPAFRGANGQFDRNLFLQLLRNNGLSEQRFLEMVRSDLGQRQLLEAVRAGTTAPDTLVREVFAFQQEKRIADAVELPFAAVSTPPEPTEAQLQRWWENHPELYSTPEFRRIKAVILSPETVGRDIQPSEDELRAAYEQRKAEFVRPERRSVQVLTLQSEDAAQKLATKWIAGGDWKALQDEAQKAGGSAIELPDATKSELPDPALADAAFSTPADTIAPVVRGGLGWYVVKVTKITPEASKTFDEAKDELRARVVADKAADLIYDRAGKIEDLLSGGTSLDELPGDMGLGAVTGTLDAKGNTPEGQPAPIPGSPELRTALVQAAFQAKKGDQPRLVEVQGPEGSGPSYYAVSVEDILAPKPKPFEQVKDAVRADWTRDAIRHTQEEAAAKLLSAVKGGQSLADAATVAGLTVRQLPATGRSAPAEGVPAQLVTPLFTLKKGEPTMVETPDGFVVAVLTDIQEPDPKADPVGFGQVRDALAKAIGDDIETTYVSAARDRGNPHINRAAIDALARPAE